MKYIALETFTDLQDNGHKYLPGDEFPRKGLVVSDARIDELLTDKNRRHRSMISAVKEKEKKEEIPVEIKTEEKPVEKKPTTKKTTAKKGKKKTDAE